MPTGNARLEKTRPQRRNGRRPSVLAVPPDEHAASPEQQSPKRRRDHERRSFQARVLFTGSIVRSANLSTLSSLQ
jgi:hypothetical protein